MSAMNKLRSVATERAVHCSRTLLVHRLFDEVRPPRQMLPESFLISTSSGLAKATAPSASSCPCASWPASTPSEERPFFARAGAALLLVLASILAAGFQASMLGCTIFRPRLLRKTALSTSHWSPQFCMPSCPRSTTPAMAFSLMLIVARTNLHRLCPGCVKRQLCLRRATAHKERLLRERVAVAVASLALVVAHRSLGF